MRKHDVVFLLGVAALFAPFFVSTELLHAYEWLNTRHALVASFAKFALLAPLGEVLAVRIRTGAYPRAGFGLIPRALVWGLLGITIKLAFTIFAVGVPACLKSLALPIGPETLAGSFGWSKLAAAFCVSAAMNIVYAPVMMTVHKVTDEHIARTGGTLRGLLCPVQVADILGSINWSVQWHFVFKKTIPLFWIPAHTITFLLPAQHQVLFAAVLGIALGVLLSLASLRSRAAQVSPAATGS